VIEKNDAASSKKRSNLPIGSGAFCPATSEEIAEAAAQVAKREPPSLTETTNANVRAAPFFLSTIVAHPGAPVSCGWKAGPSLPGSVAADTLRSLRGGSSACR